MAKNTRISNESAIAAVNAITVLLDGGVVEVRSGAQPADVSVAATGTLLGTLTLAATAFGAASDNTGSAQAIAGAIGSDLNAVAGTAGWFRGYKSGGIIGVIDGEIGTATADLVLNKVIFDAGDDIIATSWAMNLSES